jgi:hypothetical protein
VVEVERVIDAGVGRIDFVQLEDSIAGNPVEERCHLTDNQLIRITGRWPTLVVRVVRSCLVAVAHVAQLRVVLRLLVR